MERVRERNISETRRATRVEENARFDQSLVVRMNENECVNELERADGPERLTGRAMTMTMKQDDT